MANSARGAVAIRHRSARGAQIELYAAGRGRRFTGQHRPDRTRFGRYLGLGASERGKANSIFVGCRRLGRSGAETAGGSMTFDERAQAGGSVLLTGATGFLGMEMIATYLERTERDVIAFVRADGREHASPAIGPARSASCCRCPRSNCSSRHLRSCHRARTGWLGRCWWRAVDGGGERPCGARRRSSRTTRWRCAIDANGRPVSYWGKRRLPRTRAFDPEDREPAAVRA
jgi:hypothetical protein